MMECIQPTFENICRLDGAAEQDDHQFTTR